MSQFIHNNNLRSNLIQYSEMMFSEKYQNPFYEVVRVASALRAGGGKKGVIISGLGKKKILTTKIYIVKLTSEIYLIIHSFTTCLTC